MFVGDNLVGVTGNDKQKTLARVRNYISVVHDFVIATGLHILTS